MASGLMGSNPPEDEHGHVLMTKAKKQEKKQKHSSVLQLILAKARHMTKTPRVKPRTAYSVTEKRAGRSFNSGIHIINPLQLLLQLL